MSASSSSSCSHCIDLSAEVRRLEAERDRAIAANRAAQLLAQENYAEAVGQEKRAEQAESSLSTLQAEMRAIHAVMSAVTMPVKVASQGAQK